MGTLFTVRLYAVDDESGYQAIAAAFRVLHEIDEVLSDYRPGNELDMFCAHGHKGLVPVDAHLFRVLDASLHLARESDGAFNPALGPLTRLWRTARKRGELPAPGAIAEARERTGWRGIVLDTATQRARLPQADMQLDFGGIAKGYAADQALRVLRTAGFPEALLVGGGDVAAGDAPPGEGAWRVALRGAEGDRSRQTMLSNRAVSTSGDLYQFVEIEGVRYSHILDPKTGIGLTQPLAVSVVAPTAMRSDSVATALCVMGLDKARRWLSAHQDVEARLLYRVSDEVREWTTPGMPLRGAPNDDSVGAATDA